MSSILYVGDLTPGTRSEQRLRAIRDLGHFVTAIPVVRTRRSSQDVQRPSLYARVARKLGHPIDRAATNDRIERKVRSTDFDALWIEKGLTVSPKTLALAKWLQPDLELIAFSEDDMWLRHNQSSAWRRSLPVYDLVVTTKLRNASPDELPTLGAVEVHYEPKTYDPSYHYPREVSDADRRRIGGDVTFIGTYERARAEQCLALARHGLEVRVFGNGWESWCGAHPKLQVEGRALAGTDYPAAIAASTINLGLLRKRNRDEHTDRSVEIPACGGFMLAERTQEHLELFAEGREASYFESTRELIGKVVHYLTAERERERIAEQGRQRCLRSDYSHHGACARILAKVGVPSPIAPDEAVTAAHFRAVTIEVDGPDAALPSGHRPLEAELFAAPDEHPEPSR
ncbi:MAG: glycosyltransferase [Planctomycetota bacterium]